MSDLDYSDGSNPSAGEAWSYASPPTPPPAKRKPPWLLIGGIVAGVLVLAGVATALAVTLGGSFVTGKQQAPKLMPADTAMFTTMAIDAQSTKGLRHLASLYQDLPEVEQSLQDLETELDETAGVTFEEDIKPWIGGEAALGILDVEEAPNEDTPPFVLVVETRDEKASGEFLEKVFQALEEEGYALDTGTYEKVTYTMAEPDGRGNPALCLGTVKGFVVLASSADAMQAAIDTRSGKADALSKSKRYADIMATLPSDAVAYSYFDLRRMMTTVTEALQEKMADEGLDLPQEQLTALEAVDGVGLAISATDEGLRIDLTSAVDPDRLPEDAPALQGRAGAGRVLDRIPADVLGFVSGADLAAVWRGVYQALETMPGAGQQLVGMSDLLGLHIDEELFAWTTGELAVALVAAEGPEPSPIGGFGLFEIDDLSSAQSTMQDLASIVEDMSGAGFTTATFPRTDMQVLVDPYEEETLLGYGFDDKYLIVGFREHGLKNAAAAEISPITGDEAFKVVRRNLPSRSPGYLYANLERVRGIAVDEMDDSAREEYEETVAPYLEPIKAVGIGFTPFDAKTGMQQAALFFYMP